MQARLTRPQKQRWRRQQHHTRQQTGAHPTLDRKIQKHRRGNSDSDRQHRQSRAQLSDAKQRQTQLDRKQRQPWLYRIGGLPQLGGGNRFAGAFDETDFVRVPQAKARQAWHKQKAQKQKQTREGWTGARKECVTRCVRKRRTRRKCWRR